MPLAKIHVHEGAFESKRLETIGGAVQRALEEVLNIPSDDFFRIYHLMPKGTFVHTPVFLDCAYSHELILLELTFMVSRPTETRLALLRALNTRVVEAAGIRADDLVVLIYELAGENISFGKGLAQRAYVASGFSP